MSSSSVEDFLYFYAFFRRAAFEDLDLGVGALLAESTDYARSVGDSLKVQVYEALRHVAQGFLDHPRNGLSAQPEALREIYDNSLILLYRLLFVLYAESRDLLPIHESADFRDSYSLYAIEHDVERISSPEATGERCSRSAQAPATCGAAWWSCSVSSPMAARL